ncbi:regulating synaptic membrane exocytosis protein 3 isoform 1-T1 [Ciconia maguari]
MFNGDASSSAARNVIRSSSISGEMYNIEKSARGSADSVTITASKKRRSSLGAKMVAIVGLSQWSKSTLQLNQTEGGPKKLRSNIRRSTETGIAVEMRTRVTRQGSRESTDGSTNSNSSDGTFIFPTTRLGAESQFSDFLDGLGPGQLVGRQTLATPPMGECRPRGSLPGEGDAVTSPAEQGLRLAWRGAGRCRKMLQREGRGCGLESGRTLLRRAPALGTGSRQRPSLLRVCRVGAWLGDALAFPCCSRCRLREGRERPMQGSGQDTAGEAAALPFPEVSSARVLCAAAPPSIPLQRGANETGVCSVFPF